MGRMHLGFTMLTTICCQFSMLNTCHPYGCHWKAESLCDKLLGALWLLKPSKSSSMGGATSTMLMKWRLVYDLWEKKLWGFVNSRRKCPLQEWIILWVVEKFVLQFGKVSLEMTKKNSWGLGMMATFAGERVASTIRTIDRTLTPICNRFMSQALPASSQLGSQESGKDDSRISHMESHLQTGRDLLERYCHRSRNWQGLQSKFLGQAGSSSVSDASRKTG